MQDAVPPAPPVVRSILKLDPKSLPLVKIDGAKNRVFSITVVGEPTTVASIKSHVESKGWTVMIVSDDGRTMQIGAAGKRLQDVTALNIQLQNELLGQVKTTVVIFPES